MEARLRHASLFACLSLSSIVTKRLNSKHAIKLYDGTCASFCNPKVHFGLPGYGPGTIAVNVTWMKREFNACQTHRTMHPSIFNRFPVIQPVILKVLHFSTFLHILAYTLGTPLGQSR